MQIIHYVVNAIDSQFSRLSYRNRNATMFRRILLNRFTKCFAQTDASLVPNVFLILADNY